MHLLILRPTLNAQITCERLHDFGHKTSHFPISKQSALDADWPKGVFGASVITSAIGAQYFAEKIAKAKGAEDHFFKLPLFTVGDKTAQKAKDCGFLKVVSAHGDGRDLANLILQEDANNGILNILYPCADTRHSGLETQLMGAKVSLTPWPIYRSYYAQELPINIVNLLKNKEIDGICHYSALSAKHFFSLVEKRALMAHIRGIKHFALSQDILRNIPIEFGDNVELAARPNEAALLKILKILD